MMKKGERISFIAAVLIILTLFLISSTDLVISEKKSEVYNIHIILEEEQQEQYQNLKKGIEAAAEKLNVDLKYQTYSTVYGEDEQGRAIRKALDDGAQAILIDAADEKQLEEWLEENNSRVPFIVLNSKMEHTKICASFSWDANKAGSDLAKVISVREAGKEIHAYTSYEEGSRAEIMQMYEALCREAGKHGIKVTLKAGSGKIYDVQADRENVVVAVLDTKMMLQILECEKVPEAFYGVGYSDEILEKLAQNKVDAVVMCNEYDMGYLAAETAVKYIEDNTVDKVNILEEHFIYPEDVYDKAKETLLFPLE